MNKKIVYLKICVVNFTIFQVWMYALLAYHLILGHRTGQAQDMDQDRSDLSLRWSGVLILLQVRAAHQYSMIQCRTFITHLIITQIGYCMVIWWLPIFFIMEFYKRIIGNWPWNHFFIYTLLKLSLYHTITKTQSIPKHSVIKILHCMCLMIGYVSRYIFWQHLRIKLRKEIPKIKFHL